MISDRPIYHETEACPVSLDLLGRVYRVDADKMLLLIADVPENIRARLAAYLYGRSHTHELGLQVGATCTMAALSGAEGPLGEAIYAQSRQTYARPDHGKARSPFKRRISLSGSQMKADLHT